MSQDKVVTLVAPVYLLTQVWKDPALLGDMGEDGRVFTWQAPEEKDVDWNRGLVIMYLPKTDTNLKGLMQFRDFARSNARNSKFFLLAEDIHDIPRELINGTSEPRAGYEILSKQEFTVRKLQEVIRKMKSKNRN